MKVVKHSKLVGNRRRAADPGRVQGPPALHRFRGPSRVLGPTPSAGLARHSGVRPRRPPPAGRIDLAHRGGLPVSVERCRECAEASEHVLAEQATTWEGDSNPGVRE